MSGTPLLERLSAADHYSVLGDDFGWPWDIGVLAVVDGARLLDENGRLAAGRVRCQVEPRLHLVPRFRQILYRPSFGLGWPVWADAQSFDIAEHVRICRRRANGCAGSGSIRPGHCGSCGCCPACRSSGWACSCGCITPLPTASQG